MKLDLPGRPLLLAAILMAFAACDAGAPEPHGASPRPLAPSVSEYFSVAWGPGDSLLVEHAPKDAEGRYLHERRGLYVMGADGGGLRPLVLAGDTGIMSFLGAAWSPDGEWVAFAGGGYIHRVRRDGSELTPVVPYPGRVVPILSWGPDSRRIVYNAIYTETPEETGLWVVDAFDPSDRRQLPWPRTWQERCPSCRDASQAAGWGMFSPTWSPDGRAIAYVTDAHGWDPHRLAVYDVETAKVTFLFAEPKHLPANPVFSPDGRYIAFNASGYAIYVVDLAGRLVARVGQAGDSPTWSPDGRALAFRHSPYALSDLEAMCRPGREEIWVAELTSPWHQRRRQVTFSNRRPHCE